MEQLMSLRWLHLPTELGDGSSCRRHLASTHDTDKVCERKCESNVQLHKTKINKLGDNNYRRRFSTMSYLIFVVNNNSKSEFAK